MRLRDDLILRNVGGEHVIVDPGQDMVDMSKVFTLNATAAFLWQELHGETFTTERAVSLLMERYEVEEAQAQSDVEALLKLFEEQDLLEKE